MSMVRLPARLLGPVLVLMLVPAVAQAYSYAAAGKEPLIDGREALLGAVAAGDWAKADQVLDGQGVDGLKDEFGYLDQHEDPGVTAALKAAVAAKDAQALTAALRRAFADEIGRRLDGAAQNLKDYQTAKVLVVKAKRFLDAIAGDLAPDARKAADAAMSRAIAAIGNPGVFGVGRRPADPAALAEARKAVLAALRQ